MLSPSQSQRFQSQARARAAERKRLDRILLVIVASIIWLTFLIVSVILTASTIGPLFFVPWLVVTIILALLVYKWFWLPSLPEPEPEPEPEPVGEQSGSPYSTIAPYMPSLAHPVEPAPASYASGYTGASSLYQAQVKD